ncbi:phosphatidylglycerophosphatase A [Candidatus Pelagibacter ubique]|jgi:phosphatidylglycerophosphatase A|uniref:Phosphatidylglycerophosphatase A n=1 Tax=Pelagibacter ubique (strain HTCC1002) TaxID=314261 RepID=Q1UZ07_PELU1|nr:phosphatidylglycerophosphatase A [Candidatus Pelagibacter ubique]EAS84384.1 phosphatidylglycerophosphatase A [Candidatus Pelagibacter ubique HTCC1002]MDB3968530.1 phosphatidylglycerophosphatase A [Candidatus Pelagibacter ubique]MDC0373918.1 phosphatidylglycerophosphatase A [Candidatus Pelagibacter ubique]MDC0424792.1 phosphatidylglycerophosphatase A [Candidatus Pelagibacter ubique]MDC1044074.1 phosphatidylglycerophosphatase A [Candidatus Pelagibacter ubique]
MIKFFNSLLVTMFGLGKIKYMPGTFGSLATVIILYYLFHTLNISPNIILFGLIIIFIYSFYAVSSYIENSENKDPGEIIIDEFLGQSIPIYLYEISHGTTKDAGEAIVYYALFFILFRYFDIMKPFPVNFFDKNFKNSFGVIMDDICAGFYVVLTLVCFMILKNYIL